LFATPVSAWTLETVSGSAQVVPVGQAFQPLVMRVTDGSAADNPVLGTSVTFATALTQLNPEPGQVPVLLGSSAAQVVSAQNGMVSIVPSAQNVGPCAVFITVSAGTSDVQLQMESVPAIIPTQPDRGYSKLPSASRGSVNSN
jgi:hypothetical protein